MYAFSTPPHGEVSHSRRRFVTGLVASSGLLSLGLNPIGSSASTAENLRSRMGPALLKGNQFDLTYSQQTVNFTGKARYATAINGSVPAPVLRLKEGENAVLRVTNNMAEDTSIHWHGLILPDKMDGVPGISFDGIKPGETFTYRFPVTQSGTYWYHSHSGFQEQTGAYGALIIDPIAPEPFQYDRDYVVMLSDWSDEAPESIYAKLKKLSHYYNFRERTAAEIFSEMGDKGLSRFMDDRAMWNQMRMSERDISDVTGYTYTFLMNGVTPAEGWLGLFRRGERVRLRFINAAAMTFFDVRIPGLDMTVIAADGQYIEPVSIEEFRIGVAETFDVIVEPKDDRAYTIFAQAMDRSGYARGTLTPDPALGGELPAMDPAPILNHIDMGMAMGHAGHGIATAESPNHAGHDMGSNMTGMDHSAHNMDAAVHTSAAPNMSHAGHHMAGTHHGQMPKAATPPKIGSGKAGYGSAHPVRHAASESGPHIDMVATEPRYRLDDPGVGLRDNGRRVLTYADLRNLSATHDPREPDREIDLHLTGNMSRYMWSINGIKFADAEPLRFRYGERVRINLINDTMMYHPIHLHGMWSDLETGDAQRIPRKHTLSVQPGSRISYLVTADALGSWAYHCHLLYHMPGMFRKVIVS